MAEEFLSYAEAGDYLGCTKRQIINLWFLGEIEVENSYFFSLHGDVNLFPRSSLDTYRARQMTPAPGWTETDVAQRYGERKFLMRLLYPVAQIGWQKYYDPAEVLALAAMRGWRPKSKA